VGDGQKLTVDEAKSRLLQRVSPTLHSYLLYLKAAANSEEPVMSMDFSELHEEWEQEIQESGRMEWQREVVTMLLQSRFGPLKDSQLALLDTLLQIPVADLIPWLLKADHFNDLLTTDHFPANKTQYPAKSTLTRWWEEALTVPAPRPFKPVNLEEKTLADPEDEMDDEWDPVVLMELLTPLHNRLEREAREKGYQTGERETVEILQKLRFSPDETLSQRPNTALYEQWERETLWKQRQEGQQEGLLKGRQEERRAVVETLLKTRFGPDDSLLQRLDLLLQMPLTELLPWLLKASKEELRAKLGLN